MNREREIDTRDRRPDPRQTEVLREIGKFRLVDLNDLAREMYGGDHQKMRADIDSLRSKGSAYLEVKTVIDRKKNRQLDIAVLTARGKHLIAPRAEGQAIFNGQRLFDSFVRSREVFHDAAIYPAAKNAIAGIEANHGQVTKIVLDHELKGMKARLTNVRHVKVAPAEIQTVELDRDLAARDRIIQRLGEIKRLVPNRNGGGNRRSSKDHNPVIRLSAHSPYSTERYALKKELRKVEVRIRDAQFEKANSRLTPAQQREIAKELKLKVSELPQRNGKMATKILIPDVRIEYTDRHGNDKHLDLEITTSSYRDAGRKAKAAAGFKLVGQGAGSKMREEDSLWG